MDLVQLTINQTFIKELEERLNNDGPFSSHQLFSLGFQAEQARIIPSFSGLRSLDFLPHMSFLDHQVETALETIEKMNGRAILADEVGLGKTIEAGLILKEYMLRGLVKNALILVPASLVNQWVNELNTKFYIPAVHHRKHHNWEGNTILVSSLDTAKRTPHQEVILANEYDLVLIDEAHKLKNDQTKNYQFVRQIKKKYCLLLTATPIQNDLMEIFNLISILKPGHLGDVTSFKEKYSSKTEKQEADVYLKQLIERVMIRNTRENTNLKPSNRIIETVLVDFSNEESEVYEQLNNMQRGQDIFTKITLLREICSSREACYLSLAKLQETNPQDAEIYSIIQKINALPAHSKAMKAVELIEQIGDEKVIIFTEYRATQLYLQWILQQHGISSVPFRGGFNRSKKDWMLQLFKVQAQVLIATEAGAEGINLQFCHHLINYDLPWNPMKIEQRIGRIHRFGQDNDVKVYNLAVKQTIEEHILHVLYEKIKLFENVIGELDAILSNLNIADVEEEIETIYRESDSLGEAEIKLENLASIVQKIADETSEKSVGE
ncbi:DEAD/DEAH box helicase [Oceanobacillus alkalisoli]|uniref:DEAD/DEAH box helicase n=1 Tax=Oceanobacillus alkalisoli TaxID=2925113 RepID=UPI001F11E332|nr:SNF2-related protein [Oceanobacillus alkalisoli]MCF3941756.1 DEAD/DEAH box helicase [Oceanobacillus alkalisoli]